MPRPAPMMFQRAPRRVVSDTLRQPNRQDPRQPPLAEFPFSLGYLEPDEMMLAAERGQELYEFWKEGIPSAVDGIKNSRTLARNAAILAAMQCDAEGKPLPPDGEERAYAPMEFAEMTAVWPDIWMQLIGMMDKLILGLPDLGNSAGAPANSSSGAPSLADSDTPPKPNGGQ